MMPAITKVFHIMGDYLTELLTENQSLKNEKGSYDEKWLEKIEARLLKQINDKTTASSIV